MKKYNLLKGNIVFITVALLLALFTGCSKEAQEMPESESNEITVKDGRLVFKNTEAYKKHTDWIFDNQMDHDLLIMKNKSLGLKSMAEFYYEGIELIEDNEAFNAYIEAHPNVFHPVEFDNSIIYELESCITVGFLANKDGLFQIGNRIIRVTYDHNLEIPDGDESKIGLLFDPIDKIKDEGVTIKNSLMNIQYSKTQYSYLTDYFSENSKYRIVGRLHEYQDAAYIWHYDVETNAQKKTLGIWFGANLTVESSNDEGYAALDSQSTPYDIPAGSMRATHTARYSFVKSVYQIDFDYSFCPVEHYGTSVNYGTAIIERSDAI